MTNVVAVGLTTHGREGRPASLRSELEGIVAAGADAAEIALYDLDVVAGGRIVERRFCEVLEIARRFPLRYTVHGPIASNPWDVRHAEIQEAATLAYLEMTARLGAGVYVQHSGRTVHVTGRELEALRARERDYLARMGDIAGRHGFRIVVENLFGERPGDLVQLPHEVAEQVERLAHPQVAVLIDFSHAFLEASRRGVDPWSSCRQAAPLTNHLHLHDSFGRPLTLHGHTRSETVAFGMGDLHLPLGWGAIPWEEVLDGLTFLQGTIANIELPGRYEDEAVACVERARRLVGLEK
ncbi:MAG TPA: sugar phosphate isomerase/epimerase family protein [Geminicoccus sp.]|uniref:sugar phosphate isomerase/epimerase family protein n=1 Tax=Geminicoccus sp. TaxID=2024832 RepID=UPI002E35908E|nr:sugar phosphate isomerase/epimerase family protein [Geminicoccus sp.]HEX2528989.1 sugar phosphate isomerase/epimerase family protein [Geminicoccus sp.]